MLEPEYKTKLRDGTEILIRTVDPCDKKCISDGFDRLSARSRHLRFFSPINKLSDAQLTRLTEVDNVNHVVIAASEISGDDPAAVGLARYVRLKDERDVAEFAITVTDDYQGRGAGSILLDSLIKQAKANCIRILRGYVLEINEPMVKLLERHGAKGIAEGNGSLRFDLDTTR